MGRYCCIASIRMLSTQTRPLPRTRLRPGRIVFHSHDADYPLTSQRRY
jgi:hypothetical protein